MAQCFLYQEHKKRNLLSTSSMLAGRMKLHGTESNCWWDLCLPVWPKEKMWSSSVKKCVVSKIKNSMNVKFKSQYLAASYFSYWRNYEFSPSEYSQHIHLLTPFSLVYLWQCISGKKPIVGKRKEFLQHDITTFQSPPFLMILVPINKQ